MTDLIASALVVPLTELAAQSRDAPFDAVVVGSGSAGISSARSLAEAGLRVALLEAGPLALLTHVQSTDLRFDRNVVRAVQTGLQYSPTLAGGGFFGSLIGCVGGRGLFWNGAAPRFAPKDFSGWPFTAEDLDPHYSWAERELRVSNDYGAGRLANVVQSRMHDAGFSAVIGPYAVDDHPTAAGWLAGTVGNSLAPLLRSGHLTDSPRSISLGVNAFAKRVIVAGGAASGVEVVDLATGAQLELLSRSVIMAAGAFESVRLALVSALPDPRGLIGRYISDHLFCRAYFIAPYLYDPKTPEVAILWVPATAERRYQLELHLPSDNLFLAKEDMGWAPSESQDYAVMVRSFGPIAPHHDNALRATAGDRPGAFEVSLSTGSEDLELRDEMTRAVTAAGEALGAPPAAVQVMPTGASHHEAGGLIMGDVPETSVLDPYGRFRAVARLACADAAAWPNVSPANPHLTIIAWARRVGAAMAEDLKRN